MIHHLDPQRLGDQVVQVACGGLHSAVSTAGQSVLCFGFNRYGQLGQGSTSNKISTPRPVNMQVLGAARIKQLACGRHHTSVLTDKGHVYSWGASSFGRLGLPDPKKVVPLPTEVRTRLCKRTTCQLSTWVGWLVGVGWFKGGACILHPSFIKMADPLAPTHRPPRWPSSGAAR